MQNASERKVLFWELRCNFQFILKKHSTATRLETRISEIAVFLRLLRAAHACGPRITCYEQLNYSKRYGAYLDAAAQASTDHIYFGQSNVFMTPEAPV